MPCACIYEALQLTTHLERTKACKGVALRASRLHEEQLSVQGGTVQRLFICCHSGSELFTQPLLQGLLQGDGAGDRKGAREGPLGEGAREDPLACVGWAGTGRVCPRCAVLGRLGHQLNLACSIHGRCQGACDRRCGPHRLCHLQQGELVSG